MNDVRVLLDCRWLHENGLGRVVHLLCGALDTYPQAIEVTLWCFREAPTMHRDHAVVWSAHDPRPWLGQRDVRRVPDADLVIFPQPIRPYVSATTIQVMHDTTPLWLASNGVARELKRLYLRGVAAASSLVVTGTAAARTELQRELRLLDKPISVIGYPLDPELISMAAANHGDGRRDRQLPSLLFAGRFARNKNLERLIDAFAASRSCALGCRLILLGGSPVEAARLERYCARAGIPADGFEVFARVSRPEVIRKFAECAAVALVSTNEGYGLPVLEAHAAGLPALISDIAPLREVSCEYDVIVDPYEVTSITEGVDRILGADRPSSPQPDVDGLRRHHLTQRAFEHAWHDLIMQGIGMRNSPRKRPRRSTSAQDVHR